MKYLSLFSGIGGFELGVQDAFPDSECVGYSEIDKYAIKVYQSHFPNHKNHGNITEINPLDLPDFDLLVGGFPCQDLSVANTYFNGLDGARSGLFWNLLNILNTKNPKWFCFENVMRMSRKDRDIISNNLGVEPVMIDAGLVSGQNRKRLFWCNWKVDEPQDKQIMLADIIESNPNVKPMSQQRIDWLLSDKSIKRKQFGTITFNPQKANTLTARMYRNWDGVYVRDQGSLRMLSPVECERLQCFPDNWTQDISHAQRYKTLGNAVNVEVVKHIFGELKKDLS